MARKYYKQKERKFQTTVWDETYAKNNLKYHISLYSDKSSADLEKNTWQNIRKGVTQET